MLGDLIIRYDPFGCVVLYGIHLYTFMAEWLKLSMKFDENEPIAKPAPYRANIVIAPCSFSH